MTIFDTEGKSAAQLWLEIEGFTKPICPDHGSAHVDLDDDGYHCTMCISDGSDGGPPSNGSLPNGAEFDAYLEAYKEAMRSERAMIGGRYRFNYPAAFKTLPDYTAHAGQLVTVLRQLTDAECDPECQPMFEVKADDGWTGHADGDELSAP